MVFDVLLAGSVAVKPVPVVPLPVVAPHPAPEIIVTGERVARTLRDTASSVMVINHEAIEAADYDDVDRLLTAVPNVQAGSGEEGPAIRGQDSTGVLRNLFAFLGGTRPRVTLQVDGRPVSYYEYVSSTTSTWDVDRVEVFRSPQTTTQGRNSIAGAIFIETNDPGYDWRGRGRLSIGGLATRQASASVSGPLIKDQLAFRLSGDVRARHTASRMADGIADADINRDDYAVGRAKLLFEPRAVPGARIEATYAHSFSQSPQFNAVNPPFKEQRFLTPERTNGVNRIQVDSLTTRFTDALSSSQSITATLSLGNARVRRFGLPGLGLTRVGAKDLSAEAIFHWKPGGGLGVLVGTSAIATRQRQSIEISGLGIGTGAFRDRQSSLGLFGEASWRLLPALTLTAGIRLQQDRQTRQGAVGAGPGAITLDYRGRFHALLPKVSLAYDVSSVTTAGVLVQRAYNPGGTSISLLRRAADDFDAEALWNGEAFVRSTFDHGRGRVTANVFYNDSRNAQRQLTVPITLANGGTLFATEFANAPATEAYGLETEVDWRASRRLKLTAAAGLLRTKVTRTILSTDPSLGREFQRAPHLSASAAIDWRPIEELRLSAVARHHSGYYSDDVNRATLRVGAVTIVDLRAAFTKRSTTFFAYADNAFDALNLTYLYTPSFGAVGTPRTVGVGIEAAF